jgi:hypothetical protein
MVRVMTFPGFEISSALVEEGQSPEYALKLKPRPFKTPTDSEVPFVD